MARGAVGALRKSFRKQAEARLQAGTQARLAGAMAAWFRGAKMDAGSFAHHFFDRAADDPVMRSLRAAVSEATVATTHAEMAEASRHLADAMNAVGLDRWPRSVAHA